MVKKENFKTNKRVVAGIFNFAPHYRLSIFQTLDNKLGMDLYFGDRLLTPIKPLDYQKIQGFQEILPTRYFKRFYYNKGMLRLLFSGKYKILVLTGEIKNLSLWAALLYRCFNPNLNVCIWTHGPYGTEKGLARRVGRLMYRWANHLFLYGNYAKRQLLDQGIPSEDMTVVYNSLDYEKQLEIRKSLQVSTRYAEHFNNSHPTICYVGRIQAVKQLDILIEAIARLHKQQTPVNLVVLGDGHEKEKLERLVEKLNLTPYVWFYGATYDEHVIGQTFFDAELCVSPGNVGLTAIHALSYGCPVVTHNQFQVQMPEFEAVADGMTGSFFIKDDVNDLAKVICKWLDKSADSAWRNEVRQSCYAVIDDKYNPIAQAERFSQAIDALKTQLK